MNAFPRLMIAGTSSGVGKTTVTLAILAALRERGRRVQPFKGGPDFIDASYHTAAAGLPSRNLDGWILGADLNRQSFMRAAADADLSIIEGMMGLFDGSSPLNDIGSTAELAKQLEAPVLLIIDGSAMARSAAAMVSGYAQFDPAVRVAGVLFNRVSSDGHYKLLKAAVEQETNVIPLGYLRPDPTVSIVERHLGLVMPGHEQAPGLYQRLAGLVQDTVDLEGLEVLAKSCAPFPFTIDPVGQPAPKTVRIGVARDAAFCFYYPDNLELLEAKGGALVSFSPLHDEMLPDDLGLLYFGGGYPELHGAALAANRPMKQAIRRFAERGGSIYAECGGMMYLTEGIRDSNDILHEMVGLFPAEATMQSKRMTLGYRAIELTQPCVIGPTGLGARGHEFHYSSLNPKGSLTYAATVRDAGGERQGTDGLMVNNVLGFYAHLHFASQPSMATSLIASARNTICQR
ncbi:MAG TPA: cobyrinate a,c-diamide synthase [Nitrospira sp.]|nr:cobyrinate a,c-diamide synthase [Nitrospira sp.]